MNSSRLPLTLALFAPAALAAADGGAVPDRPFAEVRKDLNELKAPVSGTVTVPGLDLGVAAGIGSGANFTAPAPPAPQPAPTAKTDPGVAPQRPASSGWLLDALEENARRARADGTRPAAIDGPADADEDRRADDRPGTGAAKSREPVALDRNAAKSPLSAYMSVWLNPEDYRRLQSLYPEMAGLPEGKDASAGTEPAVRATAPAPTVAAGDASLGLGGFGEQNRAATTNPFLQAVQPAARPVATVPAAQLEKPRLAAQVTPVTVGPEAASVRTGAPTIPEAPGADDRKYFPQLKRF
jgi:hypothetical protein